MTLRVRGLEFLYPGQNTPVFKDLDWILKGPGFFSLFGLSGSGKSTLARLLTREILPDKGEITNTCRVLYAHNNERLPGWLTVGRHLSSVTPAGRRDLLGHFIEVSGLGPFLEHRFSGLSMGQRNRVNLARYAVQDFDFLIMDEVLANVDEPTREKIILAVKASLPEKTFLYISHNVAEVARYSRTVFVLPSPGETGTGRLLEVTGTDRRGETETDEPDLGHIMFDIFQKAAPRHTGSA